MDFIENWQEAVESSLAKCAGLASEIEDVDLEYALMAVGVLWPLRQSVQEFDMEAIEAVNKIFGQQAKHILRFVQLMDADRMAAPQELNLQIGKNADLDTALNVLVKHFRAFFIFADELSKQAPRRGLSEIYGQTGGARGVSPRIPPGLSEFPKILDAPPPKRHCFGFRG